MKTIARNLGLLALPILGSFAAEPLVLEIYSDFQCPFCSRLAPPTEQIRRLAGDKLRVEFKHFPLDFHKDAPLAHRAAVAAGAQGKFWEMHDLLFEKQRALKRDDLMKYAMELQLDLEKFASALDSGETAKAVERDLAEGRKHGVTGTPTMRLNGKLHVGAKSFAELRMLLETEAKVAFAPILNVDGLSKGPASAPVKIDVFLDLGSAVGFAAMDAIDETIAGDSARYAVRFRNLPGSPDARRLHAWAMAAAGQGKLWPMLQLLSSGANPELAAVGLGMNLARARSEVASKLYDSQIDDDLAEAVRLGVRGAPAVVVGGRRLDGLAGPAQLVRFIETVGEEGRNNGQ